jgi:hypothetical protein
VGHDRIPAVSRCVSAHFCVRAHALGQGRGGRAATVCRGRGACTCVLTARGGRRCAALCNAVRCVAQLACCVLLRSAPSTGAPPFWSLDPIQAARAAAQHGARPEWSAHNA